MIVFWREVAKLASLFSSTRAVKAYYEVKKTKIMFALYYEWLYVFITNVSKLDHNPQNLTPRCSILVTPCIMKASDAHRNEIAQ